MLIINKYLLCLIYYGMCATELIYQIWIQQRTMKVLSQKTTYSMLLLLKSYPNLNLHIYTDWNIYKLQTIAYLWWRIAFYILKSFLKIFSRTCSILLSRCLHLREQMILKSCSPQSVGGQLVKDPIVENNKNLHKIIYFFADCNHLPSQFYMKTCWKIHKEHYKWKHRSITPLRCKIQTVFNNVS